MAYLNPIGVRLKAMREEWNIAANELADAAGVSVSTVIAWENGHTPNTSLDVVVRVAYALGVSLDELTQDVRVPDEVRLAEPAKRRLGGPARRGERPYKDPKYARWKEKKDARDNRR